MKNGGCAVAYAPLRNVGNGECYICIYCRTATLAGSGYKLEAHLPIAGTSVKNGGCAVAYAPPT